MWICLSVIPAYGQVIFTEDFGFGAYPGAALPAGQTNYTYNAPTQPANFPDILADGDYVLATDSQQGFTSWGSVGDNTTGAGYMLLVNADDNQAGEFYRTSIALTANTTFDFLTYLVNVNSQGDFDYCTNNEGGLILPDVTLQIEAASGAVLASFDTGDIPFNAIPQWEEYKLVFSTNAATTSVDVVLINNSIGGCGNDLAIDDITFRVAVTMEAANDSVILTDTSAAQSAVLTLGANDTLDGNALPGTELYYVAAGSALPTGISLNASDGTVDVAAATSEGLYSFDYEVCETSSRFNCDIATATIEVDFPPLPITADNDTGSVTDSSLGFTSVLNVLDNDSIDGESRPTAFDLSVSLGSALPPGLTFNTNTGAVGVLSGTPSGTYSFDYDLCEDGDPANCETATVTIDVTNNGGPSVCPAGTALTTGTFNVVSAVGGQNPNFAVGTPLAEGSTETGGSAAVTYSGPITMDLTGDASILVPEGEVIEVVLSSAWGTAARAEILMSADGVTYTSLGTTGNGGSVYGTWSSNILRYDDFAVPAGGARFLQVFQQASGVRADGVIYNTQCQTGAPTIMASNDEIALETSPTVQTAVLNVIENDSFDGVTPSGFDLSVTNGSTLPPELVFDLATGEIDVVAGAADGIYSFDYDICEVGTTNCDTASVTITLTPPSTTLSASKSVSVFDPYGAGLYAVPGNDVIYTLSVQNIGQGVTDSDTIELIDIMPSEISFFNGDVDGASGPATTPVAFTDSASGLSFTYSDDVGFSAASTPPDSFSDCNYTPPGGYVVGVTYICFNPKGAMAPGSSWSVSFRARVN